MTIVKRGFKALRDTIKDDSRKLRQIRHCNTCKYNYEDVKGAGESCHNNSVTSFDMTEQGNDKYCTFWTPSWHKD